MRISSQSSDWFLLMKQWLQQGKGNTGITLPFLAGALALKRGDETVQISALRELIDTMICNPEEDFYTGVRWCGNIDAPVLSSQRINSDLIRRCEIRSPFGQISFAFTPDAMSSFGGLNCSSGQNCIEKLIQYSLPHTESGNFSRARDSNGNFVYRKFDKDEIDFISSVIG